MIGRDVYQGLVKIDAYTWDVQDASMDNVDTKSLVDPAHNTQWVELVKIIGSVSVTSAQIYVWKHIVLHTMIVTQKMENATLKRGTIYDWMYSLIY